MTDHEQATDAGLQGNAAQYKSVLPPRTIEPTHKVLKRIDEKLSHLIVALDDLGKAKCAVCGERPEEHVDGDDAGIAEEADLLLGPGYR
jgi:hypothetical protein